MEKLSMFILLSFLTCLLTCREVTAQKFEPPNNQFLIIDAELKAFDPFNIANAYYSGEEIIKKRQDGMVKQLGRAMLMLNTCWVLYMTRLADMSFRDTGITFKNEGVRNLYEIADYP